MTSFKKHIRNEMDREFFACVHWVSLIWVYGFVLWFFERDGVSFAILTEMGVAGYLMSFLQKKLFQSERVFQKTGRLVRSTLWVAIPMVIILLGQFPLDWFAMDETKFWLTYDVIMLSYFIMLEFFIRIFYREDTQKLNDMLNEYQSQKKE